MGGGPAAVRRGQQGLEGPLVPGAGALELRDSRGRRAPRLPQALAWWYLDGGLQLAGKS